MYMCNTHASYTCISLKLYKYTRIIYAYYICAPAHVHNRLTTANSAAACRDGMSKAQQGQSIGDLDEKC